MLLLAPVTVAEEDPSDPPADAEAASKEDKPGFWSRFKDPEDGKFDITAGSERNSGFFPVVLPFNEPATGVGLILAIGYFHPTKRETRVDSHGRIPPPTTTFGAVAFTENDSWAGAAGHRQVWKGGRIRYLAAVVGASVNLGFYGVGSSGTPSGTKIDFNLEATALIQEVEFQVGKSAVFLGGRYAYAATEATFATPVGPLSGDSDLAGLTGLVNYDTRDTTFTPNRGVHVTFDLGWYDEALGSDFDYLSAKTHVRYYWPLAERWVLGLRGDFDVVGDGAPFYGLSFVKLRGIPVFRYLGNYVATVEIEPRYKVNDRWSVVGFTGAGRAAAEFDALSDATRAYNFGAGFRYLMARKLGLGVGFDVARGPEETVVYLTAGSAW
jgi:hypothetical protein